MQYDFTAFKGQLAEAEKWLKNELMQVRTGQATPSILDSVKVESYGSLMPINQLGSISSEDARTLRVSIWDASRIQAVEGAITKADLGLSVSTDDKGVRVHFPELTEETRKKILKVAKDKHEQSRITLRHERDKAWTDIQGKEKAGELSEDEKFKAKEDMQKLVDETNKKLDELFNSKEKEILG